MKIWIKKINILTILSALLFFNVAMAHYSLTSPTEQNSIAAKRNLEDRLITNKINEKFSASNILNNFKIQVKTKHGIVYLAGVLDTVTQYEEAISLAESTTHVFHVNAKELKVKHSKAPLTDSYLTAKVKGNLLKATMQGTDVSALDTHVETKNRIVYLSGSADSVQQINNAIKIAKLTKGVKMVKSSLKLSVHH